MLSVFSLPILSTVPRSGTWFLRYAISFLCHLDRGGRIDDRLTQRIFGEPSGPSFDFQNFRGGPLFHVGGTLPDDRPRLSQPARPGSVVLPLRPESQGSDVQLDQGPPAGRHGLARLSIRKRTAVLRQAVHLLPGAGRTPSWAGP